MLEVSLALFFHRQGQPVKLGGFSFDSWPKFLFFSYFTFGLNLLPACWQRGREFLSRGKLITITLSFHYFSYEEGDDKDEENRGRMMLMIKTHYHHKEPTVLLLQHQRLGGIFRIPSNSRGFFSLNAIIPLFWSCSQFYLLEFKPFCQLFEPELLFLVIFCSPCCAILMLLLMSTNFIWPRLETVNI